MLEFHVLIHVLVLLPATIYDVSGDGKIPAPKKPELFVFGWPDVTSATAVMESIPMEGNVQYDLFYNLTCPFKSFYANCCLALEDLSPVNGCHKIENQLSSSLTPKGFNCTICNSTKECAHMRISKDNDLCLCLRVNTSFGFTHTCAERSIKQKIFYPPPRNIELLPTAKEQLTVRWEHPNGITPKGSEIHYKIMLRDVQRGNCCDPVEIESGDRIYKFPNLNPWWNYSVTICGGVQLYNIPVNTAACTCGNDHHFPGGPAFNRTLPEEPSDHPFTEPYEAFCDDSNFTVTLKWKGSNSHLGMNGIPQKSVIRIFNSSSSVPIAVFSVPLKHDYSGSLETFTIRNLPIHCNYTAKMQFCSNGGCGQDTAQPLGCDVCESLRIPGTSPGTPSHSKSVKWPAIAVGGSVSVFLVAVFCMVINKKKRPRNRQALRSAIGDLQPRVYEEPYCTDRTSEDASYNSLESLLCSNNNQSGQWV